MPTLFNNESDIDLYESYLLCDCHGIDHLIRLSYFVDTLGDGSKSIDALEFEMTLNHYLPWHKRLWKAILYIIGRPPRHSYCGLILRRKDVTLLKSFIDNMLAKDAAFGEDASKKIEKIPPA